MGLPVVILQYMLEDIVFEVFIQKSTKDLYKHCLQDNMKLMDDMAALRPTIFCSVPRLYNRIYAG